MRHHRQMQEGKDVSNQLQTADKIFKNPMSIDGNFLGGFNARVFGDTYQDTCCYPNNHGIAERSSGWHKANKMIDEGKIYYRHIFPHGNCGATSFSYGGTQVCNKCNRSGIDEDWWNIKVMKDGSAYVVIGEGFENLQESSNYAFGDTKNGALKNYQQLMEAQPPSKDESHE